MKVKDLIASAEMIVSETSIYEDNPTEGLYVYLCDLCGQPLPPNIECNSGLHVGPNGGEKGKAIKSTQMARWLNE